MLIYITIHRSNIVIPMMPMPCLDPWNTNNFPWAQFPDLKTMAQRRKPSFLHCLYDSILRVEAEGFAEIQLHPCCFNSPTSYGPRHSGTPHQWQTRLPEDTHSSWSHQLLGWAVKRHFLTPSNYIFRQLGNMQWLQWNAMKATKFDSNQLLTKGLRNSKWLRD